MARRSVIIGAAALTLAAVAATSIGGGRGGDAEAQTTGSSAPALTTEVVRRDLVQTTSVSGTLTYGDQVSVSTSNASSSSSSSSSAAAMATPSSSDSASSSDTEIVTALPDLGTVIDRGGVLYEVNGAPGPVLLLGARPMWRTLSTSSDDGPDVLQLEENLAALGFTDGGDMAVDEEYDSGTAAAVADWQESLGRDETGRVEPGDVWFHGAAARVAEHVASVGDEASGEILQVSGTARYVHVDLDPEDTNLVTAGDEVTVTLADGSEVAGVVFALSTVATVTESQGMNGDSSATTTLDMTVVLVESAEQALDESPVSVELVTSKAADVLAVPVNTLLALAEGGYALEVVVDGGATELVAVETGKFADGFVEVSGEISEGDVVVTA